MESDMKSFWLSLNKEGPYKEFIGYKDDIISSFVESNNLSFNDIFYIFCEGDFSGRKYKIIVDTSNVSYDANNTYIYIPNSDKSDFERCILNNEESFNFKRKDLIFNQSLDCNSICGCCDAEASISGDGICFIDCNITNTKSFLETVKNNSTTGVYEKCLKVLKKLNIIK